MKLSTVKKMLPKEIMDVVKLHKPKSYQQFRDIIREEVRENHQRQQDVKSKHAHALEPGEPASKDAPENGAVDKKPFYWDYDLCTFVSWGKSKGKGKGNNWQRQKGKGKGNFGEPDKRQPDRRRQGFQR